MLIKCTVCSREIAKDANSCPRCGNPMRIKNIWFLLDLIGFFILLSLFSESELVNPVLKLWYSVQYQVAYSNVSMPGRQPHDCDFLKAPIGDKLCSYQREVVSSVRIKKPSETKEQGVSRQRQVIVDEVRSMELKGAPAAEILAYSNEKIAE